MLLRETHLFIRFYYKTAAAVHPTKRGPCSGKTARSIEFDTILNYSKSYRQVEYRGNDLAIFDLKNRTGLIFFFYCRLIISAETNDICTRYTHVWHMPTAK